MGNQELGGAFQGYFATSEGIGLALLGADEIEQTELARSQFLGPSVNLCGKLTVRESAALMELVSIYLGHDSGPMHLAAAAGVPCLAIFSARELPGVWFPYGSQHEVIYHDVPCKNCLKVKCERYRKRCIASITVEEALAAAQRLFIQTSKEHPYALGSRRITERGQSLS